MKYEIWLLEVSWVSGKDEEEQFARSVIFHVEFHTIRLVTSRRFS